MTTYWAELDTNNVVTQVITGVDDATIEGIPTGEWYTNFVGAPCVQTWIDRNDKTYAGIGYEYLESQQDFRPPQPYLSWTWANKTWNPPTPMPSTGGPYKWSEEELEWVAV
jgi:hypothetical protein